MTPADLHSKCVCAGAKECSSHKWDSDIQHTEKGQLEGAHMAVLALKRCGECARLELDALVGVHLLVEGCHLRGEEAFHEVLLWEHQCHLQSILGQARRCLHADVAAANNRRLPRTHKLDIWLLSSLFGCPVASPLQSMHTTVTAVSIPRLLNVP